MNFFTIAVIGTGDMGSAVGHTLRDAGYRVVTDLTDRSAESRLLAANADIENLGSLREVTAQADLLLSIMPPAAAEDFARRVVTAIPESGRWPLFADCNAISPSRTRRIAESCTASGIRFVDVGIIGLAPGKSSLPTRFYASGPDCHLLSELDGCGIAVKPIGRDVGRASAIKMAYAAETKGVYTLHMALLLTAARLGVVNELIDELQYSKPAVWRHMQESLPFIAADAARWTGEMLEITDTFRDQDITPGFHEAAAWIFDLLARTPLAAETRRTADRGRTVQEALAVILNTMPPR